MNSNREKIKQLVVDMLNDSHDNMIKKIDKALDSGCLDIEGWEADNSPMILPKCVVTAILKNESQQYEAKGTSFEKRVKKEVSNIRLFI